MRESGAAIRTFWRRVVDPFAAFGPAGGVLYVVDRLLRRLSHRLGLQVYDLMAQPIGATPDVGRRTTAKTTFAEIRRGDPEVAAMPARTDIKEDRFAQGARCLGAYRSGALVAYVWFAFGRYREDEVRCDYELEEPACSVFDFDVYVLPDHRMGTAFAALWQGANEYLAAQGIRHTFSRVTHFNRASRRAHARLGATVVGRAVFLQAWNLEVMLATLAPFFSITWSPTGRVRLRLRPPRSAPLHVR